MLRDPINITVTIAIQLILLLQVYISYSVSMFWEYFVGEGTYQNADLASIYS